MNDRKGWLDWRRSGIGASDAPVVAGKAPWGSRLELWLDKKGRLPDRPASEAMEMGLILEPAIALACERKTGMRLVVEQARLRSDRYPYMLATLDRMTEEGEVVELKAAGLWAGRELGDDGESDSLPAHWIIQAHHQMIVADRPRVTFAVLHPSLSVRIYPVERNEALARAIVEIERDFWRLVEQDIPPQELEPQDAATLASVGDYRDATAILGDQEAAAATDYAALGAEIKALERRREEARARLLLSMQGANLGILPDGREVRVRRIPMPERTVVTRAYDQTRVLIKEPRS